MLLPRLNQENTMRALTVLEAGAQPVVADITTPEAGPGTVLVRIKAASLNAVDAAIAGGMLAGMMPHEYPLVIGRDAAGDRGVDGVQAGSLDLDQDGARSGFGGGDVSDDRLCAGFEDGECAHGVLLVQAV